MRKDGTPGAIRTPDLRIRSPSLYPLSYRRTSVSYIILSHIYCKLADTAIYWSLKSPLIKLIKTADKDLRCVHTLFDY